MNKIELVQLYEDAKGHMLHPLNERERDIMEKHLYFDRTSTSLAKEEDVSRSRVDQILQRGKVKLSIYQEAKNDSDSLYNLKLPIGTLHLLRRRGYHRISDLINAGEKIFSEKGFGEHKGREVLNALDEWEERKGVLK